MDKIKHMIATIQIYIHHRTGKEVHITPILPIEMGKLLLAYGTANSWLQQNLIN